MCPLLRSCVKSLRAEKRHLHMFGDEEDFKLTGKNFGEIGTFRVNPFLSVNV